LIGKTGWDHIVTPGQIPQHLMPLSKDHHGAGIMGIVPITFHDEPDSFLQLTQH